MLRLTHLLASVVLLSAAVTASRSADEKDPIKDKLFTAKVAYDKEMSAFRKAATEWFDKREEVARKAGDKKTVDQIKTEREAFDGEGELPKTAPPALKQQPAAARKTLEAAYTQAVKDYVKAKKDDAAAAVEKELDTFRRTDAKTAALLGTWKVTVGTYQGEWTFKDDGAVDSSTNGAGAGKWALEAAKGRVLITWTGGLQDKFDLPLNPKGTTGSQVGRQNMKLEAVKTK